MKNQRFGGGRMSRFLRRNGVYLVLTISLLSVAGVLIGGLSGVWNDEPEESRPLDEPVEQIVTGQADDRTTTTAVSTAITTTTTVVTEPELYVLPLTNTVQKPYSADAPVYSETMKDWRIHTGVDFAGEEGQTVKAAARGEVTAIEENPLWGWIITIDHGVGVVSKYYGVTPSVRVGDKLDVSSPIGVLSAIPCEAAQPPHLHFEMYVDDMAVNPVEAIALEVRYADTTD